MYQEGVKHHATYGDGNLVFEVLYDPKAQRRVVLQAHWTAWISPLMERMRRSEKFFTVLLRSMEGVGRPQQQRNDALVRLGVLNRLSQCGGRASSVRRRRFARA